MPKNWLLGCRGGWTFFPVAILVLFWCLPSVARPSLRSKSTAFDEGSYRMNVGDSISAGIEPIGCGQADLVTLSATGAPDTGGASITFSPNPVSEPGGTSEATLATTTATSPGIYHIVINSVGTVCQYAPLTLQLTLAPILTGGKTLWNFNGEQPSGYKVNETLTATPSGMGTYKWKVTAGISNVAFSNNAAAITTASNTTDLHTSGKGYSADVGDTKVTVTVNGVASDARSLTVLGNR